MSPPATVTKILEFVESSWKKELEKLQKELVEGRMQEYEKLLSQWLVSSQDFINEQLLVQAAEEVKDKLKKEAQAVGVKENNKQSDEDQNGHRPDIGSSRRVC